MCSNRGMHDRLADRRLRARAAWRRVAFGAATLLGALALVPPAVDLAATWREERAAHDVAAVDEAVAAAEWAALPARVAALHDVERELVAAQERLDRGLDDLLGSVTERHELRTQLAHVRDELARLQQAAGAAEVDAWHAAAAVRSLGSCLDQVSAVLNQIAVGDQAGASRAIQRLAPICNLGGVVG
jgi:hypothetical protein